MRDIAVRWILPGLLLGVGGIGGWWLTTSAFDRLVELRQLERAPQARAGAVLPGEVLVNAVAAVHERTLTSPHTSTPSLYYRYTHDRRRRNSDGDTVWDNIKDERRAIDFALEDHTGRAIVRTGAGSIDWSVRESFETMQGNDRYREYRIEPGQYLVVFARGEIEGNQPVLTFDEPGGYSPLVSNYTREEEQSSFGAAALFRLWGGLTLLALAVLGATLLAGVHRVLANLTMLTVVIIAVLVQLSLAMMQRDLTSALTQYRTQAERAAELAAQMLEDAGQERSIWLGGLDFHTLGLDQQTAVRLREMRLSLHLAFARLDRQLQATPERWLSAAWGTAVPAPPPPLAQVDASELAARTAAIEPTRLLGRWAWALAALALVLTALGSWFGYRQVRHKRLIENVPTAASIAVSAGLAETTGRIELLGEGEALAAPLTGTPCIWYRYVVQEKRRSGNKTRWVTITDETQGTRFDCEDDEGRLRVDPEDAEVLSDHREHRREGRRRHTETTLRLGDPLYAIGDAVVDRDQPDRLLMRKGEDADEPFILSNRSEASVMLSKGRRGLLILNLAFSALLLTMLITFGITGGFAPTDFLLSALTAPVYLITMMLFMHYNDLVYLKERARRNWANIEVSLRKRRNVVSGIERVVKRYLEHERDLLEAVTRMRTSLATAERDVTSLAGYIEQETQTGNRLVAAMEAYPDLKGDELMSRFMTILTTLETEIALLRKGYNDAVELFNTRIASVPDVVFARRFGFEALDFAT